MTDPTDRTDTIKAELDRLAALQIELDHAYDRYKEREDRIIEPVAEAFRTNAIERDIETMTIRNEIQSITERIKELALEHGASVAGERLAASYVRPRQTWDSRKLEGYAAAHPEILELRKYGKPHIRIAPVSAGER